MKAAHKVPVTAIVTLSTHEGIRWLRCGLLLVTGGGPTWTTAVAALSARVWAGIDVLLALHRAFRYLTLAARAAAELSGLQSVHYLNGSLDQRIAQRSSMSARMSVTRWPVLGAESAAAPASNERMDKLSL